MAFENNYIFIDLEFVFPPQAALNTMPANDGHTYSLGCDRQYAMGYE
jgi:hypothetical protein